eukprot:TRINITY_DN2481_c0_g2_i2.p1 TRINITY_DN2481_c0_g2~~TRINITY_DN2481_c0_g2_i2.p1  ORF type:complete len:160 (-),score=33.50 TRINITY_DN2481_c0_g2_i2:1163-1642(-)
MSLLVTASVLEICAKAGAISAVSFRPEFFFLQTLAALASMQALMATRCGLQTALRNALTVLWVLYAALLTENSVALLSQQSTHPDVVSTRSPFIALTALNLLMTSVLIVTSCSWDKAGLGFQLAERIKGSSSGGRVEEAANLRQRDQQPQQQQVQPQGP